LVKPTVVENNVRCAYNRGVRDDVLRRAFGRNLFNARDKKALTQEKLAQLANLKRTSVTNIEKGRQSISLPALYDLARALDMEVHDLLPTNRQLQDLASSEARIPGATDKEKADVLHWVDAVTSSGSS
jgi:transcriptional regulator with XRE-family HTH domain